MKYPGVEGIHTWDSAVVLNNKDDWPASPVYNVQKITGLQGLSDADDNRTAKPGQIGEIPYPSLRRGLTVTYEGETRARNMDDMRVAQAALRAALATTTERRMALNYHPAYVPGAGYAFYFNARCVQLVQDDEQLHAPNRLPTAYARDFVIAFRLSDPRVYLASGIAVTTDPISGGGASGITPPLTPPITIGSGGGGTGGGAFVYNSGDAPSDPIIKLYGPVTNPYIRNDTYDRELSFDIALLTGQWLELNFWKRTILLNGTGDARGTLDIPNSTWWDEGVEGISPGTQNVLYGGDAIDAPAEAQITFNPANH